MKAASCDALQQGLARTEIPLRHRRLVLARERAAWWCVRLPALRYAAGRGEFVSDFICVTVMERGRATRIELFEMEAADAALARFEELHPDPSRERGRHVS